MYLSDGRVVPSPNKTERFQIKALHTINALNLNAHYLVNWRKRWIEELDLLIDEHIEDDDSLFHLACLYLLPTSGKLGEFFTATKQRFSSIGEDVLGVYGRELRY